MELRRNGRTWGLALSETIGFEFRRRYGLTPRDPRYLELTDDEIEVDYWAHMHAENPKLREEEFDPEFDQAAADLDKELSGVPDPGDFVTVHDDRMDSP